MYEKCENKDVEACRTFPTVSNLLYFYKTKMNQVCNMCETSAEKVKNTDFAAFYSFHKCSNMCMLLTISQDCQDMLRLSYGLAAG